MGSADSGNVNVDTSDNNSANKRTENNDQDKDKDVNTNEKRAAARQMVAQRVSVLLADLRACRSDGERAARAAAEPALRGMPTLQRALLRDPERAAPMLTQLLGLLAGPAGREAADREAGQRLFDAFVAPAVDNKQPEAQATGTS